jgi:pimeloyl-ACP methyl ester carboxylesterase
MTYRHLPDIRNTPFLPGPPFNYYLQTPRADSIAITVMVSIKKIITFIIACLLVFYFVPLIVEGLKPTTERLRAGQTGLSTVPILNYSTAYRTRGEGRAVILIHGFSQSTLSWEANIDALARAGFRVYAIDLLGHGMSDKPYGIRYSLDLYARQVREFMKAMGIRRAHLAGHSMGGAVALKFACLYPSMTHSLVLIGSAGLHHEHNGNLAFRLMRYPLLGEFLILFNFKPVVRLVNSAINTNGLIAVSDDYINRYIMPSRTRGYTYAFLRILRNFGTPPWEVEDCIADIHTAALILHGTGDRLVPAAAGRRMHELLPGSRLVMVAEGPHALMETHPSLVNREIVDFLRSRK